MRIDPVILPPPARQPVSLTEPPSRPFEEFLQEPPPLPSQEGDQRAFGFCELSVFGAAGALGAPASPTVEAGEESGGAVVSPPPISTASPHHLGAHQVSPHSPALSPGQAAPTEARIAERGAGRVRPASLVADVSAPAEDAARQITDGAEPSSAERGSPAGLDQRLRRLFPAKPSALSLTVLGPGGALRVVAAAPEITSEARAALRRAVARVAAEFGLTLEGFTLNGDDIVIPTADQIGAFRGHHSR